MKKFLLTAFVICIGSILILSGCTGPSCGNKNCDANETNSNCPSDCYAAVCGDGKCDIEETKINCAQDCLVAVCGDGACELGESFLSCSLDCNCGDGFCGVGENFTNCPNDCNTENNLCGNGECAGGETAITCSADCNLPLPIVQTGGLGGSGGSGGQGSGGTTPPCTQNCNCGNGVCGADETISNCPADCASSQYPCGNGVCAVDETSANCPTDCGAMPNLCGNGDCVGGETFTNCPQDCPMSRCGDTKCTLAGDCPTIIQGKWGANAVYFNGSSTALSVASNSSLNLTNNFTISLWFKPSTTAQNTKYLLNKGNFFSVLYGYAGSSVEFFSGGGNYIGDDPRTDSGMAVSDTNWHHVVYTYDGINFAGYLDGVNKVLLNKNFSIKETNYDITIGGAGLYYNIFDGNIDEVGIWKRALTNVEVQNLYAGNEVSGATGLWHFNETNPNSRFLDSSGNGNTAVCQGGGEKAANCPADCPSAPICGNGLCEVDENISTCLIDCNLELKEPFIVPVLVMMFFPLSSDGKYINLSGNAENMVPQERASHEKKIIDRTTEIEQILEDGSRYHYYSNSSAMPSMDYQVIETKKFYSLFPITHAGVIGIDNARMLSSDYNTNICDYVDNKGVKEVWMWVYHHKTDFFPVESNQSMGKRVKEFWNHGSYGDISNSARSDDLPQCNNTYTVYHYNQLREVGMTVENHTHQIESIFNSVDQAFMDNNFYGKSLASYPSESYYRCGWTHYPPNALLEYGWYYSSKVYSDCMDWKPDGSGQKTEVNCETWAGPSLSCQADGGIAFKKWWMQSIPGKDNNLTYLGKPMLNWWGIIADFDKTMKLYGKSFTE